MATKGALANVNVGSFVHINILISPPNIAYQLSIKLDYSNYLLWKVQILHLLKG